MVEGSNANAVARNRYKKQTPNMTLNMNILMLK